MDKLQAGIEEYLSGDLYKAIRLLNEHINNSGYDIANAYYYLGLCYNDLNQISLAGQNFAKAVELAPEKSMYLYKLGLTYFRLMALDKAIITLTKTIELNPEHQRAKFILGQVYYKRGLMNDAENIFSEVLEKSIYFADAYYYRALTRHQLSKDDQALFDLNKALEINPDYKEALLEKAKINFENSNFEESVATYKTVYEKGYRDFIFIKHYLNVLKKAGKFKEFENIKTEATLLFPNNAEIENIK